MTLFRLSPRWKPGSKHASTYWIPAFAGMTAWLALSSPLWGQGVLPPKDSTTTVVSASDLPIKMGDKVPAGLSVLSENDALRTLLSYKTSLDLLAMVFVTPDCGDAQAKWGLIRHFYQDYKDWKVSFVVINAGGPASLDKIQDHLRRDRILIPVLRGGEPSMTEAFQVKGAPALVLLDEGGYLRYRGPLDKNARKAIESLISHIAAVPVPEPALTDVCEIR